ncbi:MAG: DUF2750 domain-containing protein [Alcanivoracaceae bacterium]|nr:DUF2750 domain-containing protein [Alcanivoracaceae bacterium]
MTYEMTPEDLQKALNLSADDRCEYFIEQTLANEEMWSLADGDEWMVLSSGGEEFLPVWPHPDMAAAWAGDEHQGSTPKAIPLSAWFERWADGMDADGILLAICPGEDPDGVVMSSEELKDALSSASE